MRFGGYLLVLAHLVLGSGEESVSLERGRDLVLEGKVSVSGDKEYLISVRSPGPVRIHSTVFGQAREHPVVFMVRTDVAVKTWRIPVNSSEYAATLCSVGAGNGMVHYFRLGIKNLCYRKY